MFQRNEDIDWLVNDAPAALGEKGAGFDPANGSRDVCNWGQIGRLHRSMAAVRRERDLMRVWRRLSPRDQNILAAYYTRRRAVVTLGATAAFGEEFARVAFVVTPNRSRLELALCNMSAHKELIKSTRASVRLATGAAHKAWDLAKKSKLREWVETE